MKPTTIFKAVFGSILILSVLLPSAVTIRVFAQTATQQPAGTCSDHIDNDGDGRIDWNGGTKSDGTPAAPDPSCPNAMSNEVGDGNCKDGIDNNNDGKIDSADPGCSRGVIEGSQIPCENKCDLSSVLQLLNNLITFLIKVILFPVAIIMFIYTGYTYIISQGEPGKRVAVKKMIKHLILGMVLILCAWLIVKTILVTIGYTDTLYFFN